MAQSLQKYSLVDCEITCRDCCGPLQGREGASLLKYFLVDRCEPLGSVEGFTKSLLADQRPVGQFLPAVFEPRQRLGFKETA